MSDPDKVTYFGETDSRGRRVPFGIRSTDRLRHFYVIGKTGMGKSTILENMAVQDIKNGEGLCFIDPHGKSADLIMEYVPQERLKDVIYFAPFDIENPIAFNVMEDVGPDKRHLVVNGLMSAFKKLFGEESFSDRMQYILQNTILALLEYPGSTMLGINRMLTDKTYRDKVVANVTDTSVKAYWTQEFANYTERFAAEATPAIQNKIGQFTANPLVRNIIGQSKSSFDFRKVMDEKKIIIANLSKGRVGEANANLLGAMLITKIYLAAMSRADQNEVAMSKLPNFYLYVDEFQNFANESFADIFSEARKYKLNLTIAHQYIEQMDEEVRDAVFGNVGTMCSFRVGSYDAEVLEKEFAPTFTAEDMVNLGKYQLYLKLMIDGVASQPFSATTLPPIQKPEISYFDDIIANSRTVFARPRGEVEKMIVDWHEEGKPEKAPKPAPSTRSATHSNKTSDEPPRIERRETERRAPQAIDMRGLADRRTPPADTRREYKPDVPRRDEKKEVQALKRENISALPQDDFKPLKAVSLDELKKKSNNQREPSPQNISDLRNVLSALVKPEAKKSEPVKVESKPEAKIEPKKAKEVPESELLALLGVDE